MSGGAIGFGPPAAVGAAAACPGRVVINLEGDGSAMYSFQALWTQARQNLHVITVIANNEGYSILELENSIQRLKRGTVLAQLTQISDPPIDWVSVAQGMGVYAVRVNTNEELIEIIRQRTECASKKSKTEATTASTPK